MDTGTRSSELDNTGPIRPDFGGWRDIEPAKESVWHHPLITKGGPAAIATTAILVLGSLAHKCLGEQSLSDSARIVGMLGLGVLIFAIVVVAGWFIRPKGS